MSAAEERVKESGPLLGFTIFDRQRRLVYPQAPGIQLRVPPGIERALEGRPPSSGWETPTPSSKRQCQYETLTGM